MSRKTVKITAIVRNWGEISNPWDPIRGKIIEPGNLSTKQAMKNFLGESPLSPVT
jgi:hypothetical protein